MIASETNLYQVLGVAPNADEDQIRRAFRAQVKRCHPDAGGDPDMFRMVRTAYETLSDPGRRAGYDRDLAAEAMWGSTTTAPAPPPFQYHFQDIPDGTNRPDRHRPSGQPSTVDPNRYRPQPERAGRTYPGARFGSTANRQLLWFRGGTAAVVFFVVWLRHLPLDAVLHHVGFPADAVRFPVEAAVVAAVAAFVAAPRLWVWMSTPGNRWKTAAGLVVFLVAEVLVATALLAVGAAVFIGFALFLSFGRLRRT